MEDLNVNLTPADMLLDKEEFYVNFLGMDNRNYVYVQTVSKKHSYWYSKMEFMMSRELESSSGCIPYSELQVKKMVMLRINEKYEDKLYRVRILDVPENLTDRVRVHKIDNCQEHMALPNELFDLSEDSIIAVIPPFAVKCVLEGIEFLLGINCIQNSEDMRRLMERGNRQYTAKTVSINKPTGIPKISMWDSDGRPLASKFHQILPSVCRVKLPPMGELADDVTITHADSNGFIWLQYRNKKLVDRIQNCLEYFDEKKYADSALLDKEVPETEAWKHLYYFGLNAVFITKFEESYYRCLVKRALEMEPPDFLQQYEVEFIDYGNRDIKEHSELVPAYKFDENLCFIPPQCVKVHLFGKSTLDVEKFWDKIYSVTASSRVIVKIMSDSVDCPEVEAFEGIIDKIKFDPEKSSEQNFSSPSKANQTSGETNKLSMEREMDVTFSLKKSPKQVMSFSICINQASDETLKFLQSSKLNIEKEMEVTFAYEKSSDEGIGSSTSTNQASDEISKLNMEKEIEVQKTPEQVMISPSSTNQVSDKISTQKEMEVTFAYEKSSDEGIGSSTSTNQVSDEISKLNMEKEIEVKFSSGEKSPEQVMNSSTCTDQALDEAPSLNIDKEMDATLPLEKKSPEQVMNTNQASEETIKFFQISKLNLEKEMNDMEKTMIKEDLSVKLTPADMLLDKEEFYVNFLGMDNRNYIYVQTVSKKHSDWYSKMEYMMSRVLESSSGCIPHCELAGKKMVMLRISGKYEDKLYRVRILDVPASPTDRVRVLKIDKCQEHMALPNELFDLPEDSSIALTPPFAVKCVLDGIELLLGINCIQNSDEMRRLMERGNRQYTVKTISINKPTGIPKIRMWDPEGRLLSSKFHQILISVCKIKLPLKGEMADDVTITHADSKGFIWLQYRNKKLVERIQEALEYFDETHYADSALLEKELPSSEAWKKLYYSGISAVFITKYEGSYYRCKVKRALDSQKYEVEYIDYGNRDIKEKSELIPACTFDENMCFIPPQCMRVHLNGNSNLDVEKFFDMIYSLTDSSRLVVKIMSDSVDCPEVEVFEGVVSKKVDQEESIN